MSNLLKKHNGPSSSTSMQAAETLQSRLETVVVEAKFAGDSRQGFPPLESAMIRGAFGRALKASFCVVAHRDCGRCMLKETCGYFEVFHSEDPGQKARGLFYRPHPYAVRVPRPTEEGGEGEKTQVVARLSLVGSSIRHFPHFILALEKMGRRGFGRERVPYELKAVTDCLAQDRLLYPNSDGGLSRPAVKMFKDLGAFPESGEKEKNEGQTKDIQIRFMTPLKLVRKKVQIKKLTADLLADAVERRYRLIHQCYGDWAPGDLESLFQGTGFEIIKQENHRVLNYSSRQRRRIELRGILGEYRLKGCSPRLARVLGALSYLNIGKNTSFGMGSYEIKIN